MKTILFKTSTAVRLWAVLSVFVLASCSHKVYFQPSTVAPAAEGRVKMKRDRNNNYALNIRVYNLSDPESVDPSKRYYAVWLETEDNGVKNLGQLRSSHGLFSKKLKAELDAVTPFRPRSVFITAEYDPDARYPASEAVLRSGNFRY